MKGAVHAVAAARQRLRIGLPALVAGLVVSFVLATPAAAAGGSYQVHKLVADRPGHAAQTDPNLVNAWGIVAGPSTPWWVADNGTDKSTLYDGSGNPIPLVVGVGGGPTGTVFNGSSDFVVSHNGDSGPSLFLFASEDGKIRGWNPNVPATSPPSTKSFVVADRSGAGAVYKGLAIASAAITTCTRPTSTMAGSTSSTAPSASSTGRARSPTRPCHPTTRPLAFRRRTA